MTLEIFFWMVGTYVLGTYMGHRMGFRSGVLAGTTHAVDSLRKQGYLRWKRTATGDYDLLKFDDPDNG